MALSEISNRPSGEYVLKYLFISTFVKYCVNIAAASIEWKNHWMFK